MKKKIRERKKIGRTPYYDAPLTIPPPLLLLCPSPPYLSPAHITGKSQTHTHTPACAWRLTPPLLPSALAQKLREHLSLDELVQQHAAVSVVQRPTVAAATTALGSNTLLPSEESPPLRPSSPRRQPPPLVENFCRSCRRRLGALVHTLVQQDR